MNNEEKREELESPEDLIESIASISSEEYQSIRNKAIDEARTTRHEWRMRGRGKLYCTSCSLPHTSYIPLNKTLIGIDEAGLPILKTLQ